jgi:hypothetical protein
MGYLHLFSILLEIVIVVLAIMLGLKKKPYGWAIALTFAIYTFYDLLKTPIAFVHGSFLNVIFLIATISIFWAVWSIYEEVKKESK